MKWIFIFRLFSANILLYLSHRLNVSVYLLACTLFVLLLSVNYVLTCINYAGRVHSFFVIDTWDGGYFIFATFKTRDLWVKWFESLLNNRIVDCGRSLVLVFLHTLARCWVHTHGPENFSASFEPLIKYSFYANVNLATLHNWLICNYWNKLLRTN